ncbi:MAG: disulfide bond formation protein DsbA [SAR116 cluster bacterium]|nr:disulfide bond formation protein DsbA [SAR116 cluster bacterium]
MMNNAKTPLFHPAPNAVQTRRRFLAQGAATSLLIAGLPVIAQARVEASAERAAEIRFLGKADAAVTVAEYFSMTCGHCGRFHRNTFPQVKTDLIDTGLIRFEMHPFPLDGLALRAHALCRALPTDSYFKMVDVLLDKQESWIGAADPVAELKKFAKFAGISSGAFDEIMLNRSYLEAIVQIRQDAVSQHQISSTPSFVVNGDKTFSGALSFDEFLAELNAFGI